MLGPRIAALELQNAQIERLRAENAALKARLARLERLVGSMSVH